MVDACEPARNNPTAVRVVAAMKAMSYTQYGDDSVLHYGEVPDPKVGPDQVLVRVKAASVNPVDWKVMSGGLDPILDAQFPVVPGWDVAGVVEQVGLDAPEFAVGDEIVAYARKDVLHGGTFAELVAVPVRAAARKPASLTFEEGAALPLAGLTALQTLERLDVTSGDIVLVHAAAGGVGSFAVQIARSKGATVIGTASERNHDYVRSLGADHVVTYGDGLAQRVRDIAPDGVNVSVDYVGGVEDVVTSVLAEGGRHGSIADPSVTGHGGHYMWVRPDADDLARLATMADEGALRVAVDRTFALEALADAFAASREGHTRGKIVVTP